MGKAGTGLLMLFTAGGFGIWWIYDVVMIASGSFRDADGRRVTRWAETDPDDLTRGGGDPRRQELILQELDMLRSEMSEVQERVDFLERVLAQARSRGAVSPGDR